MDIKNGLLNILPENQIFINEEMKKHTSFRVGGVADFFVIIKNENELKNIIEFANTNGIPKFLIGNGTNIIFTDKGFRGIVIKLDMQNYTIEKKEEYAIITAEAGLGLPKLSNIALAEELTGLEFMCGIPGTVGGAIRMNAGAYGSEIKDFVVETKYMDEDGNCFVMPLEEHNFSYRNSVFSTKNFYILNTKLKVKYGTKEEIQNKINENTTARREKQPIEFPSAGSTFKRKDGIITAKLIDECGLKGFKIGGAEVSKKHAGFIINSGNATADDVIKLADYIKKVVLEKTGIEIEKEVLIVGEK